MTDPAPEYPGFHAHMPFDQYLALPRLSASGAKLMARSPAHYQWSRAHPYPETGALRVGKATHALALEGRPAFDLAFTVAPECDRRTKEGKALWADHLAASEGRTVLTASEAGLATSMAEAIQGHVLVPRLIAQGDPELSMIWNDPDTGASCKGRIDLARIGAGVIIDLKTAVDASPAAFARSVVGYGYHQQAAAYLSGARELGADVTDFLIVAVEKSPPYAVGVYRLPDAALELGRRRWREACELYVRCLESGTWPGYPETITELTLPNWAISELYTDNDTTDETE